MGSSLKYVLFIHAVSQLLLVCSVCVGSDMEDLEKLYSPSQWSKRMGPTEVIQSHVKFVTEVSARTQKNIPCQLDIPYGSSEREKLDLFGTDLPDDSPIFIYIHGGYWQMLSRELSSYAVEPLYKNGHKVVVIGYDLCPTVTLPQIVEEIQRAFKYCIDYARTNQSRSISIGGHSAGAHLAISIFTTIFSSLSESDQNFVKAVYLISGIYDLVPLVSTTVNIPLKLDIPMARNLSVIDQTVRTSNDNIKFMVIVGENDSPSFRDQAEKFESKLKLSGLNSELITMLNLDHFDIVENLNNENYEITKMIIH